MKPQDQGEKRIGRKYAQLAQQGGLTPAGKEEPVHMGALRGYSDDQIADVPEEAIEMGLGCGNPTALAQLRPGQVVLDLGAGGGLDVFIAAKQVGPTGKVIGVDMTTEMVEKARQFAAAGGYGNVEFRVGRIESLPFADRSVDVVISNCVINHSSDKLAVFKEALRILRPGGHLHVSDLVVAGRPRPRTRQAWRSGQTGLPSRAASRSI